MMKRLDEFCARLNAGLVAVAIALSLLVAAQLTVRLPELFQRAGATENANTVANGSF